MPKISDIIGCIEAFAPRALQEPWDNCGLQTGRTDVECAGAMLCVDATPAVVAEAVAAGCNLIISHHPVIFKPFKSLTGRTLSERTIMAAVTAGVAIYSCHTALDNVEGGTSWVMAGMLGLTGVKPLTPGAGHTLNLTVFVPESHADAVAAAMWQAGAGHIGNYDSCSFSTSGTGTFRPLPGSNPAVGSHGEVHREPERRLEVIVPDWKLTQVERAMLAAHPYEVPAYESVPVAAGRPLAALGTVGNLPAPVTARELVDKVKLTFGSPVARCTVHSAGKPVGRVALCGGSGSSMIGDAIAAGADAYITADTTYHTFLDRAADILIVDIGHWESENCTKLIFYHAVTKKFPNFAVRYSKVETNPIVYL